MDRGYCCHWWNIASDGVRVKPDETAFEAEIEAWLLEHGYAKGDPRSVRPRARARSRRAARVRRRDAARRVGAADAAPRRRGGGAQRGSSSGSRPQIDERGTVDVLRHGVKDHGVESGSRTSSPRTGSRRSSSPRYDANRLTVTRQLRYEADSTKTLDLACSSTASRSRRPS